jgi:hypothetical protein
VNVLASTLIFILVRGYFFALIPLYVLGRNLARKIFLF